MIYVCYAPINVLPQSVCVCVLPEGIRQYWKIGI